MVCCIAWPAIAQGDQDAVRSRKVGDDGTLDLRLRSVAEHDELIAGCGRVARPLQVRHRTRLSSTRTTAGLHSGQIRVARTRAGEVCAARRLATVEGRVKPADTARIMVGAIRSFHREGGQLDVMGELPSPRDHEALQQHLRINP